MGGGMDKQQKQQQEAQRYHIYTSTKITYILFIIVPCVELFIYLNYVSIFMALFIFYTFQIEQGVFKASFKVARIKLLKGIL